MIKKKSVNQLYNNKRRIENQNCNDEAMPLVEKKRIIK